MARKNNRVTEIPPDDITPALIVLEQPAKAARRRYETDEERTLRLREEFGRTRERNRERCDRRVMEALVDWDHCCIPGCGDGTTFGRFEIPDASRKLPLCMYHQAVILTMLSPFETRVQLDDMRERLAKRHVEAELVQEKRLDIQYENNGAAQGQIYIIRQGGLIKVGWSSKLRSRLKHYGAGVEILAHYPATRAEETGLHRSLRPYLAKGREWYQDCKLLEDVVAGIHTRHGEPTIFPDWTVPKADLAARPRGFPTA